MALLRDLALHKAINSHSSSMPSKATTSTRRNMLPMGTTMHTYRIIMAGEDMI